MILTHYTITMRTIFKAFLILFTAIVLASCQDKIVDYDTSIDLCYQNNSSHHIVLVRTNFDTGYWIRELPESVGVAPNEAYNIPYVLSADVCSAYGKAIYDGYIVVNYATLPSSKQNITTRGYYERTRLDCCKYHYRYTYTFTDADYQYALENGQKLE